MGAATPSTLAACCRDPREIKIPSGRARSGFLPAPTNRTGADGRYAVLDYKTGSARTEKQVRSGLAPQLTWKRRSAPRRIFRHRPGASVAELITWCSKAASRRQSLRDPIQGRHADSQADRALARLTDIVADSRRPRSLLSLVHPMWKTIRKYDHLARSRMVGDRSELDPEFRMSDRRIPDDVLRLQRDASDPSSRMGRANAGAGQDARSDPAGHPLLLDGVDPAKSSASTSQSGRRHMANRVFNTLAGWTALTDARSTRTSRSDAPTQVRPTCAARRLFASALETRG